MNRSANIWESAPRMPPYSTDPALSHERYADPSYVNSSDPTAEYTSDRMSIVMEAEHLSIPSSPPKHSLGYFQEPHFGSDSRPGSGSGSGFALGPNLEPDIATDADYDEPTDDDEANEPANPGLAMRVAGRAYADSTLRPGSFTMAVRTESSFKRTAETVVAEVFDNERITDVNLDNLGLCIVPQACRDLINHEDLGRRSFKLDLSCNYISRIGRFLYDFGRLEYLSLRFNRLTEVTPLVVQLTELRELHLGNNELQTLPAELLRLPKFRTLTTYPNNFIAPPANGEISRLYVVNPVPSLAELASREIANAGSCQEFQEFEKSVNHLVLQSPELMLQRLLEPILDSVYSGSVCSICMCPVIRPMAYHLYWTRHGEDRSGETVPFKTVLCSAKCLNQFRDSTVFLQ